MQGDKYLFRVDMTTLMEDMMFKYNEYTNFENRNPRWLFDGNRIKANDTPKSLDLMQDDVIEVMFEQQGGSSKFFTNFTSKI